MSATGKVSLEQLARDITKCKEAIASSLSTIEEAELFINEGNEPLEPQLIKGYTAEQWQEIIDGGYLCEVRDTETEGWYEGLIVLKEYRHWANDCHSFGGKQGFYNFCRPAQIKGVMRPIFVEPVDDVMWCSFFGENSHLGDERWGVRQHTGHFPTATKYIEL